MRFASTNNFGQGKASLHMVNGEEDSFCGGQDVVCFSDTILSSVSVDSCTLVYSVVVGTMGHLKISKTSQME